MHTLFSKKGIIDIHFLDYVLKSLYYTSNLNMTYINNKGEINNYFPNDQDVFKIIKFDFYKLSNYIHEKCTFTIEKSKETLLYSQWGILNFIVAPLYHDDNYQGSIIAGPMFLNPIVDKDIDQVAEKYGLTLSEKFRVLEAYKSIPIKQPPRNFYIGQLIQSHISQSLYMGRQNFGLVEQSISSNEFIGSSNEELTRNASSWIAVTQMIDMVLRGDGEGAVKLYKSKLAAPMTVDFNRILSFDTTRLLATNLCMVIAHEMMKLGVLQNKILNVKAKLLMEVETTGSTNDLFILGERILEVYSQIAKEMAYTDKSPIIKKAIEFIEENYMNHVTLQDVANIVNLNPSYFSHTFKNEMKVSFTQYLNQVRIKHSQLLLKNTDRSLQDIAYDVGYERQQYFSKIFKQITTMSPSTYRKQFSHL